MMEFDDPMPKYFQNIFRRYTYCQNLVELSPKLPAVIFHVDVSPSCDRLWNWPKKI